jgi:hypothetical protein
MLPGSPVAGERKPQVVVISLDGAKPDVIDAYRANGVLDPRRGLGALARNGVVAEQNVTITPSVTAAAHIAIATGANAASNDIPANTYHAVAQPITSSTSGFAGPIGGYQISPLGPNPEPTAEPLWVALRAAGKKVVTATWPGADGLDVRLSGTGNPGPVVQPAEPTRTVDFTVPFGAFGGLGAQGFERSSHDFEPGSQALLQQLAAAGRTSYSPVVTTNVETVFCSKLGSCGASVNDLRYVIRAAALDTTNDNTVNYDELVFYDVEAGLQPGPFRLPATGPAYAKRGGPSARFYFEGSGNKVGTAFFFSQMAPDLSTVRFMRYSANYIPRNPAVLADVDEVNANVGFWAPQPDFRIPERLSPGFDRFPDLELEAAYEDQVRTFVDYQTRLAVYAIRQNRDADLVMVYIEQPDGSGHQFTVTDPRQATDPRNPLSIGTPNNPPGATGQDQAKIQRYRYYLQFAYQQADRAVQRILNAVGVDEDGEPLRDVFVVSDHGMAPFHTAVSLSNLLRNAGVDTSKIGIRTTGPATNIYVDLEGREPSGKVKPADYRALVNQIARVLRLAEDPDPVFNPAKRKLFSEVWTRPVTCGKPGFCTDRRIGQDTGDILALMIEGYNFDGIQSPPVARYGEPGASSASLVYSVPNFYGGPSIRADLRLRRVRNIDVAPTVMEILGVQPARTVEGRPLERILRRGRAED